jgi:hypothetical protein
MTDRKPAIVQRNQIESSQLPDFFEFTEIPDTETQIDLKSGFIFDLTAARIGTLDVTTGNIATVNATTVNADDVVADSVDADEIDTLIMKVGQWRFITDGADLVLQRNISSVWVEQTRFVP